MNNWNNILENIRKIRIDKGLSQEYMAVNLNISQAGYGLLETGKRKLTYNHLLEISDALECDIIDIITYPKKLSTEESSYNLSNRKVSITFEADEKERAKLVNMILQK